MNRPTLSPGQLGQLACILEVAARKPGNVHPGRSFEDAHLLDFFLSAAAIVEGLNRAATEGIGAAVLQAVEATRLVVATNTNLGMVLLIAPLAAVPKGVDLHDGVASVLESTTVEDARRVYRAIRLAQPGGLGSSPEQDIESEPSLTLRAVMCLAAQRDLIARQYANTYTDLFKLALPALRSALDAGRPLETAIIAAHLTVLAHCPDTLIARKLGFRSAQEASRRAGEVLAAGWPETDRGRTLCESLDDWLRAEGHARNPGATADLVSAALFAALRDGTIELPRPAGPTGWSS